MNGRLLSPRYILPACLILRLLVFFYTHPWTESVRDQILVQGDSPLYHRLACGLLDEGKFISDGNGGPPLLHSIAEKGKPDDLRTPIYPLFVAAIYVVFGRVPWIVCLVQILLDTFTCGLLFVILRRAFNERSAAWTALCYAFDPYLILSANALLTETLFIFFMVFVLGIYVVFVRDRAVNLRPLGYALLGLAVGWAALVRPIALYLPLLLAPFALFVERRRLKIALLSAALLVIASGFALSPWLIRNYRTFGHAALTYIDSWDLLALNVAITKTPFRSPEFAAVQAKLVAEADQLMINDGKNPEELNNFEKAEYWKKLALHYAAQDPVRFAWYHIKGMANALLEIGTSDILRALRLDEAISTHGKTPIQMAIAVLILAVIIVTYSGALTGLVIGWRVYDWRVLTLCCLMIFYFLGAAGALGVVRLKLPVIPFYLTFTGIGFAEWRRRWIVRKPPDSQIVAS
jgi:4-amino-4-deoxy-L-arabinose transferase-like glycosyltransferase